MSQRGFGKWWIGSALVCLAFLFGLNVPSAHAQAGSRGTVTITVLDPSGKVVPTATLRLVDLDTNSVRQATTAGVGTYNFVGLPIGNYQLTVSKAGFSTQINNKVTVQAGETTDVTVKLEVGTGSQRVVVSAAAAPLLQTTSSTIATTVNMKQLQDLPLSGRDVSSLAFLTPGFSAVPGVTTGTWNGLPAIAQGNSIDGVISHGSRGKFAGNATPGPQARLDSIQQMTVETGDLNVNEGYGQAAMQTTFVTQRGSNSYHGRVYEDFRNSYLNANSWYNDAVNLAKDPLILNDFGGDFGGPILKNKLFFFGAFAMSKQPGGYIATASALTPLAQQGFFTESSGTVVCLLTYDPSKCPQQTQSVAQANGLPTTLDSNVAAQLTKINGALAAGKLAPTTNPNVQQLSWFVPSPQTTYFPTVRVDYNLSQKVRMDLAWNDTRFHQPGASASYFPGSAFSSQGASRKSNYYTSALGIDWTISPTLINQFRGGYYYESTWYAYDATNSYLTQPIVNWALGTSGQNFNLPITIFEPVIDFSDGMTWQKSSHMVTFGFSYWHDQNHYFNAPSGITDYTLGLVAGDPAYNAFEGYFANSSTFNRTNAEKLYATLIGRISSVGPNGGQAGGFPLDAKTGQYYTTPGQHFALDEPISSWGFYVHDSWRMLPTLTVNYGLRWDLLNAIHDVTGGFTSASTPNIYGPSAIGDVFQPGALNGVQDPVMQAKKYAYQNAYVTPQPEIGFAWNPRHVSGLLARLTGDGNTVIRAGYMLRRFTEPQQYYYDGASDYGFAFHQYFYLHPSTSGATGTFVPGSLALGDTLPAFGYNIAQFSTTFPESGQTFLGHSVGGMNYNIRQPYIQQWNLEFQRQFGQNNVLAVRYIGSHTVHEWISQDPNEVNIFQSAMQINGAQVPGFLAEFEAAQQNLAINAAAGKSGNFADLGFTGDQPLPLFQAAFAGEKNSAAGVPLDYSNHQFVNYLNQGNVGSLAATMANVGGAAPYFCNLVGTSFGPCASNIGYTRAGAGYPINYFLANPYGVTLNSGTAISYISDAGFGNYNGLQLDFRQNNWHGMQFDANYTWSHALGIEPNNQWQALTNQYTLRNIRLSYQPSLYDIRQVFHISGTYDLPFGKGKQFLSSDNPVVNKIVGGWTLGTIVTYQTGVPFLLSGGYDTYNASADGGVVYHGLTNNQLQSAVGVYSIPGAPFANGISPQYLSTGGANAQYLSPNTVPGAFGYHNWLYGPHFSNTDIAITKSTSIRESLRLVFQAEFLNAFNHPNWEVRNGGIQSSAFGQANVINSGAIGARQIQLRASIDF